MKTIQGLASQIAKIEGKKSQVAVGNIREIVKIFFDIAYVDEDFCDLFNKEMKKRDKKVKPSKRGK